MTNDDQFISAIDLGEDQIDRLITNLNWKMFISSSVNFNGHFERSLQASRVIRVVGSKMQSSSFRSHIPVAFAVNERLVSVHHHQE